MPLNVPLAVRIGDGLLITQKVAGLQIRREAIGGVKSIALRLDKPLASFDPDLAMMSKIRVFDARSAEVVAEGRLTDTGRGAGSDGQQWDLVAFGPGQHVTDIEQPLIYIDRTLSNWTRTLGTRPNTNTSASDTSSSEELGAILLEHPEGKAFATGDSVGMTYRPIELAGMQLGAVAWTWDTGSTTSAYEVRMVSGTVAVPLASTDLNAAYNTAGGSMSATVVDAFPSGRTRVTARSLVVSGSGSNAADRWAQLTSARVLGRRMLKDGTLVSGVSGMVSTTRVRASQVVEDLLGRILPEFDGANATVSATSTDIDQLAYTDGVTAEQVLNDLMTLEPAFRWTTGPDVTGNGYAFRWESWPTTVRYEATLDDGGSFPASAQELYNRVVVRWRSAAGTVYSVTRTKACRILDDAGVIRQKIIDLGDEVGSSANAALVGDNFLAEHNVPKNAGTLTIARRIRDLTTGRMVEPFEIEPGELIRVRGVESYPDALNASSNDGLTVFRIWSATYNSDSHSAELELDADARTVTNALAKLLKQRNRKR